MDYYLNLLAWGDKDGDRVGASAFAKQCAVVLFDRHLAGDVVNA